MGIINFQGKRTNQQEKESVPILVSDYMSKNLITFKEDQSIEDVIDSLIKNKISGGPVVNDKNELVGIISEGDCIKQISESRYHNLPIDKNNTVSKAMITQVETIDGDMNIFDAANKFLQSKRRRFPITENGRLIGLISQKDVLKAAMKLKGNTWK
ncbi:MULTISPECIES: CBS domain-containing protein [unclassified Tenacibaculum]|uniref:CBS domain-containing protein n=1 Tax=unclassified Tenacibaculum TaxID=2635139 RepID=UPI001F389C22|nr:MULTISPECIES: CBS domain-containing protein [unclassified Tenacibaculum]MCF2875985.1 CBS domain-containing protein [Tenacibaculum sp. Cn5-1]MCF2936060.1 CBS domain-containing protein [Tenacibaculum sp. Cn5-34]MCG7512621.1 CBS domain-containing protein [Tenacibaculum sp. Cn5-46]